MIVMCDMTNSLSDPTPSKIKKKGEEEAMTSLLTVDFMTSLVLYIAKIVFFLKSNKPNSYGYFNVLREEK